MTRPVHTVKYMQTKYRKYQFLAIVCALLTIGASLLAALSGIQIGALRKAQAKAEDSSTSSQEQIAAAAQKELEEVKTDLSQTLRQLASERQIVNSLQEKVTILQRQLEMAQSNQNPVKEPAAEPISPSSQTEKTPEKQAPVPPAKQQVNQNPSAVTKSPETAPAQPAQPPQAPAKTPPVQSPAVPPKVESSPPAAPAPATLPQAPPEVKRQDATNHNIQPATAPPPALTDSSNALQKTNSRAAGIGGQDKNAVTEESLTPPSAN